MKVSRRTQLVLLAAVIAVAALLSVIYISDLGKGQSFPAGCTKPSDGYLIIASDTGYNDSIGHGAPYKSWPIINVQKGSTVNITVCNIDHQAHGFQISHYFEKYVETLLPNQVLNISFVADQAGTFDIYCNVFCTIHVFMQNGELVVT